MINMTATRQMAIILAFGLSALEKGSRLQILFILSLDFEMFLVSFFSWIVKTIQCFHINFISYYSD